jgi:hypothetical protein
MSDAVRPPEPKPAFFFAPAEVRTTRTHEVAVFVRTHKWDAKVEELVARLAAVARNFDLYVLYDVKKAPPPPIDFDRLGIPAERLIPISERMCADAGFYKGPGLVFYHCGDIPLCYAMRVVPTYRYYAMLDWDVYFFPGRESMLPEFLATLLAEPEPAHFVGLKLHHITWGSWYPGASKVFPDEACHYAYFPFIVLSRPLLALVYSQRQLHETIHPKNMDLVNGELFVPSLAYAAGMKMRDLKEYAPTAYGKSILLNGGEDGLGLPIEAVGVIAEDVAMIHPVYTAVDFVERARRKYLPKDGPKTERLRTHLARPEWAFVPPALTSDLRAAVEAPATPNAA